MASELPKTSHIEQQEQSLLDDASTLLMFSKGRRPTNTEQINQQDNIQGFVYTNNLSSSQQQTTQSQSQSQSSIFKIPLTEAQQRQQQITTSTNGLVSGEVGETVITTPPSVSRSSFVFPVSPVSGADPMHVRSVSDSIYSASGDSMSSSRLSTTVTKMRSPVEVPSKIKPRVAPKRHSQSTSSSPKTTGTATTTSTLSHSPAEGPIRETQSAASVAAAAALTSAASVPLPSKKRLRRTVSETRKTTTSSGTTPKKRQWPVPNTYIVDPDAGIITCICGYSDDDGFTIQCDHCNRWQHAICYDIESVSEVPDHFLCNACQPRRMNIKMAKLRQKRRRALLNLNEPIVGVKYNVGGRKRRKGGATNNPIQLAGAGPPADSVKTLFSKGDGESKVSEEAAAVTAKQAGSTSVSVTASPRAKTTTTGSSTVPTQVDTQEKKREFLVTPVEAQGAVYVPIITSMFKEKIAKLYIERHMKDRYVENITTEFEEIPTEVKEYGDINGSGNTSSFKGFTKLGLFAKKGCSKGDFIAEVVGEIGLQRTYIADPKNHYRLWGTPKRKVIFHPQWPLVIDQRQCGNLTRYLRRSCHPNVELATISSTDNGPVKFVLRALQDIEKDEELHMNWQWDSRHPILQLINGSRTFDSFDDTVKYTLIHSIDTILGSCECACRNVESCHLYKIKKIAQELYESVKSNMNNRYKLNEVLARYQLNRRKRGSPILEHLASEATRRQNKPISSLIPPSASTDPEGKTKDMSSENNGVKVGEQGEIEHALTQTITNDKVAPYRLPYRLGLLHNYSLTTSQDIKTSLPALQATKIPKSHVMNIKDILEYDESKITDLNKLAVPITLPHITTMQRAQGTTTRTSEVVTLPNQGEQLVSQHGNVGTKDGSSTEISGIVGSGRQSPVDLSATSPSPTFGTTNLRKKLSFADYRKKQQRE